MAQLLAAAFPDLDKLAQATKEELMQIGSVGPKIAESVVAFFIEPENLEIIRRLKESGVKLTETAIKTAGLPLAGKEFVLTGKLETLSRPEAEEKIKTLGGVAKDNMTRKTAYVVAGEDPGSKLARAQALGIKVINEKEFLEIIGNVK